MEGLNFENITQLLQLVAIVSGIGIIWWKVPSKIEMERARESLRAEIRENRKLIIAFLDKINAGLDRFIDKIDADSRAIQASIGKLTDKIEANTQVTRGEMDKLADKIDANTQAMDKKQWG